MATASSGQVSDWSEPQKFIVATRGTGSQVAVSNLTAELLGGNIYLIRGKADPGTTIHARWPRGGCSDGRQLSTSNNNLEGDARDCS